LGIGPGDEVITSPFTFCATANVIVHTGATPVFADISSKTFNMDPRELEKKITPKTKAVIAVHYGGHPADMGEIMDIARLHDLKVIEDAAHAPFAAYKGWMTGAIGHTGCFSFYATKNLTTAEGGMLTTNIDDVAGKARALSLHGLSDDAWDRYSQKGSWYYEVIYPGFKYNMTDVQAAIGLHQMDRTEAFLKRREQIAAAYEDTFGPLPELVTPYTQENVKNVRHLYTILLKTDLLDIDRAGFIEELKGMNIGTSVHFIPVHLHPYYKETFGFKEGDFPVAEKTFRRIISLPIYPKMTNEDAKDVIEAVKTVVERHRK
jgi:dTDP-4-amino-4,6-dideoxygalactose transaminase